MTAPSPRIPYDWARVECPTCGAAPDTRCRARSGRTTDAHVKRLDLAWQRRRRRRVPCPHEHEHEGNVFMCPHWIDEPHEHTHQPRRNEPMSNRTIGVLAGRMTVAQNAIADELAEVFNGELVPLTPRSQAHRGRTFDAIVVVDADLWPLSGEMLVEYVPCLAGTGGSFYLRLA
ncbi:hypothetical protein SEA_JUNIORMINT_64 [Mycobacterium phage Juniormint]|nr:hypothetical protein SEA_JUNIORMINT_64 [Mycobacterium phage Juniormint]